MISETIDLLQRHDFYGAGKYTELAKGQKEYITTFREFRRKVKRLWRLKKR